MLIIFKVFLYVLLFLLNAALLLIIPLITEDRFLLPVGKDTA